MKSKDPKKMIPIIRKTLPNVIAEELASIQPMQGSTGSIFSLNVKDQTNPWGEWRKTTSFWPRKSVNGKWIFGFINKRGRWDYSTEAISGGNYPNGQRTRIREFATNKELFERRLRGDDETR